jgi:hypothetical protein
MAVRVEFHQTLSIINSCLFIIMKLATAVTRVLLWYTTSNSIRYYSFDTKNSYQSKVKLLSSEVTIITHKLIYRHAQIK